MDGENREMAVESSKSAKTVIAEPSEAERRMMEDIARIEGLDEEYVKKAWDRWDTLCKPLRSFGALEENVVRMAGIERSLRPVFDKPVIAIMAADNGVVEEGVSQTGCEVTTQVLENMAVYASAVCLLGREIGAEVVPVDLGAKHPPKHPRVLNRCIRRCTGNIAKGPAMSREEAARAVNEGIEVIRSLKDKGYHVVITGEMGIGNTTTSSAMAAVLLGQEVETVTGRGAGLSTEGLNRKIAAIRQAIAVNKPDKEDILDVVSKVGGFDIAGLIGCFLGAALCHLPVLIDGFISSVAAYCAVQLCPKAKDYMFATHCSGEPAGRLLLDALGLQPVVMAGMRMGEGTGAVVGYSVMKAGFTIYDNLPSFAETAIEEYHHLN